MTFYAPVIDVVISFMFPLSSVLVIDYWLLFVHVDNRRVFGAFLLVQSKLFSMQSFCKPTFIGDDYILRVTGYNLVRDD